MELLGDWRFVLAASLASFIIGLSRGGFAGGIAFAGVLIMAQMVEPTLAAAFILPILCFIDPFGNYVYRKDIHWPSAKVLLPGGLIGIVIGASVFYLVDDNVIRILVAGLSLYLVVDRLHGRWRRQDEAWTYPKPIGFALGIFAGISTFIIHAGHPPVSAYLLPQRLPRLLFIGTFALLFTVFNYVKLLPYAWLGLLDWSLLGVGAVFFPVAIAGFFCGKILAQRMSDKVFYWIMYASIVVMGLKIGVEGVLNMLAA